MLTVNDLKYSVGNYKILNGVSFNVKDKEFVGIMGPNGSGKSTVLKNIYKLAKPDSGEITLDGENVLAMSNKEMAKRVSVVAQEHEACFDYTVEEVVLMGRYAGKKLTESCGQEDRDAVAKALETVGMSGLSERGYLSLSGGEKQRVILARAIAQNTETMILDEPTNHLDIKHQLFLLDYLKNSGKTVLTVLHDLRLAAHYCDRIYLLLDGNIVAEAPAESDEFNSRRLGLQWEWHANYQDAFGFTSDLGYMRIYGHVLSEDFVNFWEVPNLLLQKFPAEEFAATTKLKVVAKADGQQSGLIVMGWDYCYIGVEKQGDRFVLKQVVCKDAEQQNKETSTRLMELPVSRKLEAGLFPNYERDIYLRVKVGKNGVCHFHYSLDGKKYQPAGEPFTARQGKWIGAKVGLFSTAPFGKDRGWVDADWFRIEK